MGGTSRPAPSSGRRSRRRWSPRSSIAGAGSGKTTLMAARVVYLVATGQVRPDQVLGLTFTTKAASRAARHGSARRCCAAGSARPEPEHDDDDEPSSRPWRPTTPMPPACSPTTACGSATSPTPACITDASRYQLGARVVDRYTGRVRLLTDHPPTAIQYLLALDGAMSEHLVVARTTCARSTRDAEAASSGTSKPSRPARAARPTARHRRRRSTPSTGVRELIGLVDGYRRLKRDLGLMDFSDQIELGARLAVEQPEVGRAGAGEVQGRAARRVPGHLRRPGDHAARLFSATGTAGAPAVGDPNQAIYGWRGASVSNILDFADTSRAPRRGGRRRFPLTVNRRSDRRILEVANRLAAPLLRNYGDQVARLRAQPVAGAGRSRRRGASRPRPTSWPGWPRGQGRPRGRGDVVGHRRAHPRQRARRRRLRRAHRAPTCRSRSSACPGCSGCPRSPRSWRC